MEKRKPEILTHEELRIDQIAYWASLTVLERFEQAGKLQRQIRNFLTPEAWDRYLSIVSPNRIDIKRKSNG